MARSAINLLANHTRENTEAQHRARLSDPTLLLLLMLPTDFTVLMLLSPTESMLSMPQFTMLSMPQFTMLSTLPQFLLTLPMPQFTMLSTLPQFLLTLSMPQFTMLPQLL